LPLPGAPRLTNLQVALGNSLPGAIFFSVAGFQIAWLDLGQNQVTRTAAVRRPAPTGARTLRTVRAALFGQRCRCRVGYSLPAARFRAPSTSSARYVGAVQQRNRSAMRPYKGQLTTAQTVGPNPNGKPTSARFKQCMLGRGWRFVRTVRERPVHTWVLRKPPVSSFFAVTITNFRGHSTEFLKRTSAAALYRSKIALHSSSTRKPRDYARGLSPVSEFEVSTKSECRSSRRRADRWPDLTSPTLGSGYTSAPL
jgi:hypothetical protein